MGSHRTERRLNLNIVIALILYAWIVRCIEIFDNNYHAVSHCNFVSVDA